MMFLCTGCGTDGPPLVPVRGMVTLDGQPVAGKSIRFFPEPGTPGVGAGANTGIDGKYELIAVRPGAVRDVKGVPPGIYKVTISEPIFLIEFDAPEQTGEGPAPAIGLPEVRRGTKSAIPAQYTNAENTPLKLEVTADGGVIDLELSSK
jgi:hypothetical protein